MEMVFNRSDRALTRELLMAARITDWIIFNPPSTWKWSKIWLMMPLELLGKEKEHRIDISRQKSWIVLPKAKTAQRPEIQVQI